MVIVLGGLGTKVVCGAELANSASSHRALPHSQYSYLCKCRCYALPHTKGHGHCS